MPFFDDSGYDETIDRGPFWSAFAIFGSQLEKMIAVNIAWALQFAPAIFAMIFIDAPDVIRILLILYTIIAVPPATAVLYGLMREATNHESIDVGLARELFGVLFKPSYKSFAPLLGFFGFVLWSINVANAANWFLMSVLLQVFLLLLILSANYWGCILAGSPKLSAYAILLRSARIVWRYPLRSLLLSLMVGLAVVLGAISIGGLALAVPVIITLLQAQMYKTITRESFNRETAWGN
jgi:hypothetical protein